MTTQRTPSANAYLPVLGAHTALDRPGTTGTLTTYDRRVDELPHTGAQDEFSIEDYIDNQPAEVVAAIDSQGPWVADQFYPGVTTLATLRLRAGLSQKELAVRCGVEQPHISRYEAGNTEPGLQFAKKIAEALGVSLDVLALAMQSPATKATA